jgi:hypothetical protein
MSRVNSNASEQSNSPLANGIEGNAPALMNAGYPMVLCGVQRKINTGSYENIDVYCAVSIPVFSLPSEENMDVFLASIRAAVELGFNITSEETGERYRLIREMQREGRPAGK